MTRHVLPFAALAVAVVASPAGARPGDLPAHVAPSGMRSLDDAGGGRILIGALGANVAQSDAFRTGLHRIGGYFSHSMHLESVVRSNDGRITMASFDARLAGEAVRGLALTSYGSGASQVAVVFDTAGRLPHTLGSLVDRLRTLPPPAVAVRGTRGPSESGSLQSQIAAVPTVERAANDGTVFVKIPQDWQVKRLAEGAAVVDGPDGAEVVSGMSFPMVDPRGPVGMGIRVPYDADPERSYETLITALIRMNGQAPPQFLSADEKPIAGWGPGVHAAEVTGTSSVRGKTMHFDQIVAVGPQGPAGGWIVSVSGAVAPVDRFERDKPEMGAILQSYRIDNEKRQNQVAASIAQGWANSRAGIAHMNAVTAADQATVDASMRNARSVQDGIDRSTAGFVHYLNDTDVVAHSSGAHFNVDGGTSQALTSFDPEHYRSVPVSQYVKGVDY